MKLPKEEKQKEKQKADEEAKQDKKDLHNWEKFIQRMKDKGALIEDKSVRKQPLRSKPNRTQNKNLQLNLN